MKRSEAMEALKKVLVITSAGDHSLFEQADMLLEVLEKKGIMPPNKQGYVIIPAGMEQHFSEFIKLYTWEKE